MNAEYPAIYRDQFGEEATIIYNDGQRLRMTLRGVEFSSTMLDDWEPMTERGQVAASFQLDRNELRSYTLSFTMPVPVVADKRTVTGKLWVQFDLGAATANGRVDHERLQLELTIEGVSFKSCGKHGLFEDELNEIERALPTGTYIKSCFACAFSDYAPAGNGLFGCLACFRNTKQEYLALKGKAAFHKLQNQIVELVQETYLCPEFEKRVPGTGYRG